MSEMCVQVSNLDKTFETQSSGVVHALHAVDLEVRYGEILTVLGPSGCGKTTLLNILAGFESPSSGVALVHGEPVGEPHPSRGVVFQQAALFPWLRVDQNMLYGPKATGQTEGAEDRMREILEAVGLASFSKAYPRELSGGMRQRVAIARTLMNNPEILLLDEPFGALDAQTRLEMQEYVLKIHALFGTSMLLITHDVDESIYIGDRVAIMSARPGSIVEIMDVDEPRPRSRDFLTSAPFAELKRRALDLLHPIEPTAAAG